MSLDLAFLLALACVAVALATGRLVAALPGLAGELGVDDMSDELMHALERGLYGFRAWVLAAPFCWLVAAWATNHATHARELTALAQGAGLIPIFGVLFSIGAGLWRFSVATSAAPAEDGAEAFGRDFGAVVLAGLSALAFALSIGGAVHWVLGLF
jgi:hypothetical protein